MSVCGKTSFSPRAQEKKAFLHVTQTHTGELSGWVKTAGLAFGCEKFVIKQKEKAIKEERRAFVKVYCEEI